MRYWAKLNNNRIVIDVIVADEEDIVSGRYGLPSNFVETVKDGSFRYRFAGIGMTYDLMRNAFIDPKPYPSWVFNEEYCQWDAPVPYPQDGKVYNWDEDCVCWVLAPYQD